jgi:hypothetical protein
MNLFDEGLVFLPSGVKSGKLHSIAPNDGSGDLAFSNASVRTRVNKQGVMEMVPGGIPRLEYKDGAPRMIMEPIATNMIPYPVEYSNGYMDTYNAYVYGDMETAGTELCENGTFEVNLNGWSACISPYAPQSFIRNVTTPITGVADCKIIASTSNDSGISYPIFFEAGRKYLVTLKYRKEGSTNWRLRFTKFNSPSSVLVAGTLVKSLQASSNTFVSLVIVPKETISAFIVIHSNSTAGGNIYFDNFSIREIEGYIDPFNHKDALKFIESETNIAHYIYKTLPLTIGSRYTFSFFAKKGERRYIYFAEALARFTYFDLETGTVGSRHEAHKAEIHEKNGFYHCFVSFVAPVSSENVGLGISLADGVSSYAGDGVSGFQVFGIQLCMEDAISSFIYDGSEGAAKTRARDQVTLAGTCDKNIVSGTWSIIIDVYSFATPSTYAYCLALLTSAEKQVSLGVSSAGKFVVKDEKNGVFPWPDTNGISAPGKICIIWDGDQLKLITNGAVNATLYTPSAQFNEVDNLEWIGGAPHQVNALVVLPYALSDSQSIQITQ